MLHQRPIYAISDGLYDPGSGGISGEGPPMAFRTVVLGMPFFALIPMNNLRQYAMFPVRLLVILLGFFSSFFVIVMGKPWREEWNEMNVRAYLIEGKNWNAAGF
jgi:hypothetical protein